MQKRVYALPLANRLKLAVTQGHRRQVAHIADFAQGKPHTWASFEDAWQVQSLIESLLH